LNLQRGSWRRGPSDGSWTLGSWVLFGAQVLVPIRVIVWLSELVLYMVSCQPVLQSASEGGARLGDRCNKPKQWITSDRALENKRRTRREFIVAIVLQKRREIEQED
jgi:hypothetical protein